MKYSEEVKLSPNVGGKIQPKFIVLHHSSGSFDGTISWILNPISKVSYHYVINPDNGNRVQLVYDTKRAWHAGVSFWRGQSNLNSHSIGIAFSGDTNMRTPADHEIESCAEKCIYLMKKFDIKKSDITTHEKIAPRRKNDCSQETFDLVLAKIDELLTDK